MPTPLDAISARRFSFAIQHRARVAICQHVRGRGEIGPRWRRGSNARRPDLFEEAWTGVPTPCHVCGGDGGEIASWQHYEYCSSCGSEWPAGDYDWWSLADVLRFRADEAAGLIEGSPESLIVHGFDVMTAEGIAAFHTACAERRELREAGHAKPWLLAPEERLAQLRSERAGYLEGRAGRPLPADADEHFSAGHVHGAAFDTRLAAIAAGVLRHG